MKRIAISLLLIFSSFTLLAADSSWTGVERIVAVGDIHGDFGQLISVLRSAGLIDSKMRWSGGKTHLVQLGDLPDRGAETRKVMDLLMQLEKQASRAGGYIHVLIGNHEAMNVYGDLRYVTPEEFASFRDENSEALRQAYYKMHLEELAADPARAELPEPDEIYRQSWEAKHPLGFFEHRFQFSLKGKYGKWIASHNTIIQINDTIFVHGGISPKYADMEFDVINDRIREEFKDFNKLRAGIVIDPDGPLWYRGLASEDEEGLEDHLRKLLSKHNAQRIVIAHSPIEGAIMPRFAGQVINVDVGLSAFYGSRLACLLIEGDKIFALHRGKKLEIPSSPGLPLLRYLQAAAALDPAPSPLDAMISKIEEQLRSPVR